MKLKLLALVLSGLPLSLTAQQNELTAEALQRQKAAAPSTLDQRHIIVNRRQPIPFRPFEMIDVVTNRPIPADSILTFPDGKSARAGEYFEKLNEIERGLNEIGYSLREDWDSIVIQRSAIDQDALSAQARRIRSATNSARAFRPRALAEFSREVLAEQPTTDIVVQKPALNVPTLPQGPQVQKVGTSSAASRAIEEAKRLNSPAKPVKVTESKEFPFEIGDPNIFAASVNGKLDLDGSEARMKLSGFARAGVSIFGVTMDVARLDGWMNAPKKGNMTGNVNFDVLPFGTIYTFPLNGASISKEDNITRSADVEFANFRVMIGPVPVQVKAGAQGSMGLRYYAGLNPASAVAEFAPIVRSNLYVQAGIDIVVAGAGAGAAMTLVNYDLALNGSLRLWNQVPAGGTKPELGIQHILQVSHKLNMLSGNAYAYAYLYVPRCCIPPWTKKEWRWEMFNWPGFTVDGELANVKSWTSLAAPTK